MNQSQHSRDQRITLYYSNDTSACYAADTGGVGLAIPLLSHEFTLRGEVFSHRSIWLWPYDCGSSELSTHTQDAIWLLGIEADLPATEDIRLQVEHHIIDRTIGEVYTLWNYPPTINHIRTALVVAPPLHEGDLIMNGCMRMPLTLEDVVFHRDFGFGKIQGIIRGKGDFVQVLFAFRWGHELTTEDTTLVAIWTHTQSVCVDYYGLRAFIQYRIDFPDFAFAYIPEQRYRSRQFIVFPPYETSD